MSALAWYTGFSLMDPTRTAANSTEKAVRTVQRRFRMTLHQAKRSGGFSTCAGKIPPCMVRRRSTRASRGVNTSILFWSLSPGFTRSPPIDRYTRSGLKSCFRTSVKHAFRRAVGNKNDVFWLQEGVRLLTGKDLAEVHRDFSAITRRRVRADDSSPADRRSVRRAFGQGERLQHGNIFVVLQDKTPRLLDFSHHVHDSGARHFDDVPGTHRHIQSGVSGLHQFLEIDLFYFTVLLRRLGL